MSATRPVPGPMSLEEFLMWHPADGRRWQLIDGRPQAMAPAAVLHGVLQAELATLLNLHLRQARPGCAVVVAPGVSSPGRAECRIPDLAVTCNPADRTRRVLASPLLVVEILSPGNPAEAWLNVWAYTGIAGLAEILVLRSDRIGAQLLRRTAEGTWPDTPEPVGPTLTLTSIGFAVPLADLYRGLLVGD